jgi:hypothetical protein
MTPELAPLQVCWGAEVEARSPNVAVRLVLVCLNRLTRFSTSAKVEEVKQSSRRGWREEPDETDPLLFCCPSDQSDLG